eukprot:6199908-Pleurochrysis_carterae.AAC.2
MTQFYHWGSRKADCDEVVKRCEVCILIREPPPRCRTCAATCSLNRRIPDIYKLSARILCVCPVYVVSHAPAA